VSSLRRVIDMTPQCGSAAEDARIGAASAAGESNETPRRSAVTVVIAFV